MQKKLLLPSNTGLSRPVTVLAGESRHDPHRVFRDDGAFLFLCIQPQVRIKRY
jgi:hypothetical protein